MQDRFDKFTENGRKVLKLAQEEAQHHNHNYIGTEHLLLGLIRIDNSVAVRVLENLGVDRNQIRKAILHIIGHGDRVVLGEIGMTPRAKKVIELGVDEARRMNHHYIGTEHILLGLIREGEGIAAGVLASLGVTLEQVRVNTLNVLASRATPSSESESPPAAQPAGPKTNVVTCRLDDRTMDALDALVEAGIRSTRSDAAAWLIGAGIESHRPLFDRVYATVREIRQLRQEAQEIARQVVNGEASASPDEGQTTDEGEDESGS